MKTPAKSFLDAVCKASESIRSESDLQEFVNSLYELWGGRGGDDVEAQIMSAVLLKACWESIAVDEIVASVIQNLEA